MDTEKCAALLCALEEGTLARAAERLGYTPSGISRLDSGDTVTISIEGIGELTNPVK